MIVNAGGKNIYPGPIEDLLKTSMWIDQIVLLGESQRYISALIVPDYDRLKNYAKNNDISYDSTEELLGHEKIQEIYQKEVRSFSKQLASHEKVRKFRLLPNEFTVESGELTPTLKVKRRIIEEKYSDLIEGIYADDRN
jgi:long-chain acyl-CoA synthetase